MKTLPPLSFKTPVGLVLAIGFLTACVVSTSNANLILNGSFERPALSPGTHFSLAAPSSWTGTGNNYGIHNFSAPNGTYPAAQDGNQYWDDSSGAHLTQGFTIATAGNYLLTWFDGTFVTGNSGSYLVKVLDNSLAVVSSQAIGYNYNNGDWHQRSMNLTGLATGNYFLQMGFAGGGTFLDNVVLDSVAVPEPTTVIAGALLLLPFGVTTLRALRKQRTL